MSLVLQLPFRLISLIIYVRYNSYFGANPAKSDSLSRIISPQHAARIKKLVDETKGNIITGGEVDVDQRYVAPTIVRDVANDDSLMSEYVVHPNAIGYGKKILTMALQRDLWTCVAHYPR